MRWTLSSYVMILRVREPGLCTEHALRPRRIDYDYSSMRVVQLQQPKQATERATLSQASPRVRDICASMKSSRQASQKQAVRTVVDLSSEPC